MTRYYIVEWRRDSLEWRPSSIFAAYKDANKFMQRVMGMYPDNNYRTRSIQLPEHE